MNPRPVHFIAFALTSAFALVGLGIAEKPPQAKFAEAGSYDTGPVATSLAVADLRGTGTLDLVATNYCETVSGGLCTNNGEGGVSVLLGNGDATYQSAVTYGTGAYAGQSVAIRDMNGDGNSPHSELPLSRFESQAILKLV
jgi:hypothetical protein